MLDLILPTHRNGYKAHLIKIPALIFFTLFVLIFNLVAKVDINAQDAASAINQENLLIKHNQIRNENGLNDLKLNSTLSLSASNKAMKMLELNCWSHYCPPNVEPWTFFEQAGYIYIHAGENLAEGFSDIDELVNAWMNSKTHRENILKNEFQEVGFGIVMGTYQGRESNILVIVHFGTQSQFISQTTSQLKIISPRSDELITSDYINVNGTAVDIDSIDIYNNSDFKGKADILDGIFTFKILDPNIGLNIISAKGILNNNPIEASVKAILHAPINNVNVTEDALLSVGISKPVQLSINFFFLVFLSVLFLVDFLVITKTQVVSQKRSLSHYHFSLFIILGLLIIIGGFAGNINTGIFQ